MALLSPYDPNDLVFEDMASAPDGYYNKRLPKQFTLRSEDLIARDQQNRPTCVAFTAAVLAKMIKKVAEDLSPEWIYRHRDSVRHAGMFTRNALQILQTVGVVKESHCPYQSSDDVPVEIDPDLYQEAHHNTLTGYTRITTKDGLKRSLLESKTPCIATIEHYNSSEEFWRPQLPNQRCNYHAVLIVGYNKDGVELLNSWGPQWADSGYTLMKWEDWPHIREIWAGYDGRPE